MESPHTEEYNAKHTYTPWPANGRTGSHLRKFAHLLQAGLPGEVDPGLVLLNAVPFQCSLGKRPIDADRDLVFRGAWKRGAREGCQQRLLHWYREGDLIVNACTIGGAGGPPLRMEVEAAIGEALPGALRLRRFHPFRWFNESKADETWRHDT